MWYNSSYTAVTEVAQLRSIFYLLSSYLNYTLLSYDPLHIQNTSVQMGSMGIGYTSHHSNCNMPLSILFWTLVTFDDDCPSYK